MLERIVSGGQTGVDRAALDVAIEADIPYSGFIPTGRIAEDGSVPPRYKLAEVPLAVYNDLRFDPENRADRYRIRTLLNVRQSDATLIVVQDTARVTPGSRLTIDIARKERKPCLLLSTKDQDASWRFQTWIKDQGIKVLNIAGSRESKAPGIYDETVRLLRECLAIGPDPA